MNGATRKVPGVEAGNRIKQASKLLHRRADATELRYTEAVSTPVFLIRKKQENDEAEGKQKPRQRDTNREVQLINETSMPARQWSPAD